MGRGDKRVKQPGAGDPGDGGEPAKKNKAEREKKAPLPAKAAPEEKKEPVIARTKQFVREVQAEFGKIVWPERKQTMGTTAVVVVLVIILSFYLGTVDLLLGKLVEFILD
jgi:preprotein translocase subunit SecE